MTYNVFSGTLNPTHFTSPVQYGMALLSAVTGFGQSYIYWLLTFCLA